MKLQCQPKKPKYFLCPYINDYKNKSSIYWKSLTIAAYGSNEIKKDSEESFFYFCHNSWSRRSELQALSQLYLNILIGGA